MGATGRSGTDPARAATVACGLAVALLLTACADGGACVPAERRAGARAFVDEAAAELAGRTRARIVAAVLEAECEFGVHAYLLLALAERESRFDPAARGPRGSLGLLQLRPTTAAAVARDLGLPGADLDLLRVETSVRLGAAYLARLLDRMGSPEAALVAYNAGPTRARRMQRRGLKPSSSYSRAILARFAALRDGEADGR